jgi:hypothetical protein
MLNKMVFAIIIATIFSLDYQAKKPELARELLDELKEWRKEVGAKMPVKNPYFKYK